MPSSETLELMFDFKSKGLEAFDRMKDRVEALASSLKGLEASGGTLSSELSRLDDLAGRAMSGLAEHYEQRKADLLESLAEERRAWEGFSSTDRRSGDDLKQQAEIIREQQGGEQALLDLARERASVEERLLESRREIRDLLSEIEPMESGLGESLTGALSSEEGALEDFVSGLDQAYESESEYLARTDSLRQYYADKQQERQGGLEEDETAFQSRRLSLAASTAGSMSDLFDDLYESTGKKQKEFFYLAKAAAVAEAIINIQQGVTKALAQGGAWGWVQAASVTAQGAAALARIYAQELAEGGLVKGWSPHSRADNITARLTAGEFVQPVETVRYYGAEVMEALRSRLVPREVLASFEGLNLPPRRPAHRSFAVGGIVSENKAASEEPVPQTATIVNVLDRSEISRWASSLEGQRAILNVMTRNAPTVRKMTSG